MFVMLASANRSLGGIELFLLFSSVLEKVSEPHRDYHLKSRFPI